ncbi:MAG: ribonuclease H-like domain-containing protein [Leptospiraceae bacterium]|nr:ribonuclease H-like domain-containing protein [Leptospiraceae bacterium]MCP5496737.1 ribonuclease H-like domain-containing protein [Leptospiraceae bacterium]
MIEEAFLHFKRVGKKTLERLKGYGIQNWYDVLKLQNTNVISKNLVNSLVEEIHFYLDVLETENISCLVNNFKGEDKWRILGRYFDRLSYFDIETDGLGYDSRITLIVCYHKGRLYEFVRHENLEGFLDLLNDIELLVSFNGQSFDVPWVRHAFHIPELPCPHIDLRWVCKKIGLEGGLKSIEWDLGIQRPSDLIGVGGYEAVLLWDRWERWNDVEAKRKLIRYCSADVLSLQIVTAKVLKLQGLEVYITEDAFRLL